MKEEVFEILGWIWGYTDDKKIQDKCSDLNRLLKEEITNEKFLDYFEAERVMNGECSPEDIYTERKQVGTKR